MAICLVLRLLLLLPFPLFMLWYSYAIDRNGWFQSDQTAQDIAAALLAGNAVTHFMQMEERQILKLYSQGLAQPPHTMALGSSRILQLDRALTGDATFFNAGMTGAEYPDVYSSYYLFARAGLVPDIVILSVDPWLFSAGADANTFKRVDLAAWQEYLCFAGGQQPAQAAHEPENMSRWLALTSPAFFQETMDYAITKARNGARPTVLAGNLWQEPEDVKMPDGSVHYGAYLYRRTPAEVQADAGAAIRTTFLNCEGFLALDGEHCRLFEEFVQTVRHCGSFVVFELSPYHPDVYEYVLQCPQRYAGFFQVELYVRQYAAAHGIPVYGSYDPQACGCKAADFFDAWHVKGSGLAKFLPRVADIEAARTAGTLPDPLAVTPRLPVGGD